MTAYRPTRFNFRCPKCSNTSCETGEIRAAGGFWGRSIWVTSVLVLFAERRTR
jgi:hypothetical protein